MKNVYISLMLILLVGGAMASLSDCWTPSELGNVSTYEFISGYDNYNLTSYSKALSSGDIDAAANTRMGTTGMTFIGAVQYQEADLDRGFGGVWFDPSTSRYYSIWQYTTHDGTTNEVYSIPNLRYFLGANGTTIYSDTGNADGNEYIFLSTDTYTKLKNVEITAGALGYVEFIKYGDDTVKISLNRTGSYTDKTISAEGYSVENAAGFGHGALGNPYTYMITNNATNVGEDGSTSFFNIESGTAAAGTTSYVLDYYAGCGSEVGNVTFYAIEGSTTCDAGSALPTLDCSIDGDTVTIPAGTSNVASDSSTIPAFKDATEFQSGYWDVNYNQYVMNVIGSSIFGGVSYFDGTNQVALELFKSEDHLSQLTLRPWNPVEPISEWLKLTSTGESKLQDTYLAGVLRYNSPTGSVDNVPIESVFINTTMELSAKCDTGILGIGDENYTMMWIRGLNTTHYKRSNFTCLDGVPSAVQDEYSTSFTTLADDAGDGEYQELSLAIADLAPIWKDTESRSINRMTYFSLEFNEGTSAVYNGQITIGDNENFLMAYNYTNATIGAKASDAYPYGTYFWSCEVPFGYEAVSNVSGYIEIDAPLEVRTIYFQQSLDLGLNLTLTQQGSPIGQVICQTDSVGVVFSDPNGLCRFENVPSDSAIDVTTVTANGDSRSASFPIGDYYNSERYGTGASCVDFQTTGDYVYIWDIESDVATLSVRINSKSNPEIGIDAQVYWDGTFVGEANREGKLTFETDWNFSSHNLTAVHDEFLTKTQMVRISRSPFTVEMIGAEGSNYVDTREGANSSPFGISRMGMTLIIIGFLGAVGMFSAGINGGLAIMAIGALYGTISPDMDIAVSVIILVVVVMFGALQMRNKVTGNE